MNFKMICVAIIFAMTMLVTGAFAYENSKTLYCCNLEGIWKDTSCYIHKEDWCVSQGSAPEGLTCAQKCVKSGFVLGGEMQGTTQGIYGDSKCVCTPAIPDFTISAITADKENYNAGDTAVITVTIKNLGEVYSGILPFSFNYGFGSFNDMGSSVTNFQKNAEIQKNINVKIPTSFTGDKVTIVAIVDKFGKVEESNEANNGKTASFSVGPQKYDFEITNIRLSTGVAATIGEPSTVKATVKNNEKAYSGNVDFHVRFAYLGSKKYLVTKNVNLAKGQSAEISLYTFTLPSSYSANYVSIDVTADPLTKIIELNEDNNKRTGRFGAVQPENDNDDDQADDNNGADNQNGNDNSGLYNGEYTVDDTTTTLTTTTTTTATETEGTVIEAIIDYPEAVYPEEKFEVTVDTDAESVKILFSNKIYDMYYSASRKLYYYELTASVTEGNFQMTFTLEQNDATEKFYKTVKVEQVDVEITSSGPEDDVDEADQRIYVKTDKDVEKCKYSDDDDDEYEDMKSMTKKNARFWYKDITADEGKNTFYAICESESGKETDKEKITFTYEAETVTATTGTVTGLFGLNMGDFMVGSIVAIILLVGTAAYLFIFKK